MGIGSASGLKRSVLCPASMVLPRDNSVGEAAIKGSAIHEYLYNCSIMDPSEALSRVPAEYQESALSIDLDSLPPLDKLGAELTVVYDIETDKAFVLGQNLERAYQDTMRKKFGRDLKDSEVVGTVDIVYVDEEKKTVGVLDYKTGFSRLDPAKDNWQIKFLCLAFARAHGFDHATGQLVFVRDADGVTMPKQAEFGPLDLELIADDLRELYKRFKKAEAEYALSRTVQPTAGSHCKHCPSFSYCPAQTTLIKRLANEPDSIVEQFQTGLTAENLGKALDVLWRLDEVKKRSWAAVYRFVASNGPIDVGGGRSFGTSYSEEDQLNPKVVREVLAEMFDENTASAACDYSTSKAQLERAVKAASPKGKGAENVRKALVAISKNGGITTKRKAKTGLFDSDKNNEGKG